MLQINGLPVHPLIIHAVVVLLPLAAVGSIVIAVRRQWRRSLGLPVLLIALAGTVAVPIATTTGEQLMAVLPPDPLIARHEQLGDMLLPYAVLFAVLVAATVVAEFVAGRRQPSGTHALGAGPGTAALAARATVTTTWSRVAAGLAVLSALAGIGVTYLVVLIGDAGATAAWHGVGQ
jgi:hypothetical protein